MDLLWQDLRHAARSLRRSPAFTVAAVATLALGIGANTAVFSLVNAALLRALPFPEPGRLVALAEQVEDEQWTFSPPNFVDVRAQNHSFDALVAMTRETWTLTGSGDPVSLSGSAATADFGRVVGVRPELGRYFDSTECVAGQDKVVVLSHALWQDHFGARRDIVGASIVLDGDRYTVVGVLPAGAELPRQAALWIPMAFTADQLATQRGAHYIRVIGRLKPGVTLEQAVADGKRIAAQLAAAYPSTNQRNSIAGQGLRDALVGDVRTMLLVLLGTVTLVLLIACTNVANLLLARASGRVRDVAVSLALGARRSDLIRRSIVESLLLALTGAGAGVLLASWITSALGALRPGALRNVYGITVDGPVLGYTLLLSIGTGLVFGLLPVWRAGRATDVHQLLRAGGRGVVAHGASWRLRSGLVAAQLAIAVTLLTGSGLMIRSFIRLQQVDPGFSTVDAYQFRLSPPDSRYGKPEQARAFYASLLERLRALPGVTAVSATSGLPLDGNDYQISVRELDGRLLTDAEQQAMHSPQVRLVTPGYLPALKVPFVEGRDLSASDAANAPLVVVVNSAAAKALWPGVDPVGHHLEIGTRFGLGGARGGGTVVGVVRDVHDDALSAPPNPTVYFAHAQFAVSTMTVVMRTAPGLDPRALAAPVRSALKELDPELPPPTLAPLQTLVAGSTAQPRFATMIIGFFAAIAVALAVVGIYGVMANLVAQRESEIGIRMALGAGESKVVREIVGRMVAPVAAGVALGLAGSVALSRLLASLLYEIKPSDPPTLAIVAVMLVAIAFLASYVPARRASRIDPMTALRSE